MGKGTIISHDGGGLYSVQINYDRSGISEQISELESIISRLDEIIDDPDSSETKVQYAKANKLSAQKRIDFLENADKVPDDETISAWCADLTEDLSGEVGTVEIGRERQHGVNIQPGYDGNAVHDVSRDGQLAPTMSLSTVMAFLNLGFLPGAQKWKPMYRYGTITDINYDTDTANVFLNSQQSSQQSLDVNQSTDISSVSIEYMDCNASAFETGDEVLVKFDGYDWEAPKIIGFRDNPKPCECYWTEPWDGPSVTSKWAWVYTYTAYYFDGLNTYTLPNYPDQSTISITECPESGDPENQSCSYLTVSMPRVSRMSYEYDPELEDDIDEYIHKWVHEKSEAEGWVNPEATSVLCNVLVSDVPQNGTSRQFSFLFSGEDESGDAIQFGVFFIQTSDSDNGLPVMWGYVDGEQVTEETGWEWNSYYNAWVRTVENGKSSPMPLPVSPVKIDHVELNLNVYRTSYQIMEEVSAQINHLGVC